MKRLLLLMLVGIMVVAAGCGSSKVEEEVVTTEEVTMTENTTTERTTATEAPTTEAPFEPMSGESNGVRWRTFDLRTEVEIRNALRKKEPEPKPDFWLTDTVRIYEKDNDTYGQDVWMQDTVTGKEEILLQQEGGTISGVIDVIDDRFFAYKLGYIESEWSRPVRIYDTYKKQEVSISYPHGYGDYWGKVNGKIYMVEANSDYYGAGEFRVLSIDIAALKKSKPVVAMNLLKDMKGIENPLETSFTVFSPDMRYLASLTSNLNGNNGPNAPPLRILVIDITQRKLILDLEQSKGLGLEKLKFINANTLYNYRETYKNDQWILYDQALEITLP